MCVLFGSLKMWINFTGLIELFDSLKINLEAAFWINCRGLMELAGRPAKRALQ